MLTQSELDNLLGVNESLTLAELNEVYLPIVERITLKATEHLKENPSETFIIGIAGSVAVGKSTSARVIHALLARNFERAALVSTDNFIPKNLQNNISIIYKPLGNFNFLYLIKIYKTYSILGSTN